MMQGSATKQVSPVISFSNDPWPDYRGPQMCGHSPAKTAPVKWSELKGLAWKTALPNEGFSSPAITNNLAWMTHADPKGAEQWAIAVDINTGKVIHNIKLFTNTAPEPLGTDGNTYASPSVVSSSGRVFVHFGTYGTAALDAKSGKVLWTRRDLNCQHYRGPGSSPVIYGNLLICTYDGIDTQFVAALDVRSGATVWKTARSIDWNLGKSNEVIPDMRKAYSTPIVVKRSGQDELITVGARAFIAYDPKTGRELWKVRHGGYSNAARPVVGNGMLYVNSGFDQPEIFALPFDKPGPLTDSDIAWQHRRGVGPLCSPLATDGLLFIPADSDFLRCLDGKTGQDLWSERLGGRYYASPLLVGGLLYLFADSGKTTVVKPGRTFEKVAENFLDVGPRASVASIGTSLIMRTRTHLVRINGAV